MTVRLHLTRSPPRRNHIRRSRGRRAGGRFRPVRIVGNSVIFNRNLIIKPDVFLIVFIIKFKLNS